MKMRTIYVALLGFLVMYGPSLADELLVPGEYLKIQAAIDASVDGDVIIVADGTYTGTGNKNLDFGGHAITVRSENGPEFTIIDCENQDRGFLFRSGEDGNSVLEGFTIRNGNANSNSPESNNGGAIFCLYSSPNVRNCVLRNNTTSGRGGGIYCYVSSMVLSECKFIENTANTAGGGLHTNNSTLEISDCEFLNNSTVGFSSDGGGIDQGNGSNCTITNCLFAGNSCTDDGGGAGIRNYNASGILINCTFTGNSAQYGGILNGPTSSPIYINCILWGNSAYEIYNGGDSHPTFSYCDIEGGWNGLKVVNQSGSSLINGGGNIAADPLFIDAVNPDLYARDYHLSNGSPCIDAAMDAGVDDDIEGNIRPIDFPDVDNNGYLPEFDIGAYEAVPLPPNLVEIAAISIEKAIIEKIKAIERIDAGLEQEWTAYDALEELLESGDYGDLNKGDIVTAKQEIHSAIQHQELAKKTLQRSIEKLLYSLSALGYGPQPPGSSWPPYVTITQP